MPDHNDAPEEHLPNGAAFPDTPAEEPDRATMIGDDNDLVDDAVVVDASEVQATVHEIEEVSQPTIGEGEPLPVGANDPEVARDEPTDAGDPPGMPHEPDDLDREMAAKVQARWDAEPYKGRKHHPEDGTVLQANACEVEPGAAPFTPRGALITLIASRAHREREILREYGDALRRIQETRDSYVRFREQREEAISALFVLGLDVEGDHAAVEPSPAVARIPDSMIV